MCFPVKSLFMKACIQSGLLASPWQSRGVEEPEGSEGENLSLKICGFLYRYDIPKCIV
jgi:hypothetical protein